MQPPLGPATVCFDATPLIHFNKVGRLNWLGEIFDRGMVPNVVFEEEIRRHRGKYPENQKILEAGWLDSVPLANPADIALATDIHMRFGRDAGQDRGEADLVVLAAKYGWTAILDDTQGQRAARDHGAAFCSILTMILAAAGFKFLSCNEAWKLHCDLEASRGGSFSALKAEKVHRPAFNHCFHAFSEIAAKESSAWPHLLAHPGLEGLVTHIRDQSVAVAT